MGKKCRQKIASDNNLILMLMEKNLKVTYTYTFPAQKEVKSV